MDAQLMAYLGADLADPDSAILPKQVRFVNDESTDVELLAGDDDPAPMKYPLKPLSQLYGHGTPERTVDPQDDAFLPLFACIEEDFVLSYRDDPRLTDGDVRIALDLLEMDPDGDVQHNTLARRVQLSLRLLLSLNDYSRQEVRQAARKIRKSVDRHTRLSGRRGYLDFIRKYLPAGQRAPVPAGR